MTVANHPSPSQVTAAADAIYRAWLPKIGAAQAREQAQAFVSRFQIAERAAP